VIGEKLRYHGVALARLVQDAGTSLTIRARKESSRCAYVINEDFVIYVKYSTSRLSPWRFGFSAEQKAELESLGVEYPATWIVLVCGHEGVLTIPWADVRADLEEVDEEGAFSLQASRRKNEKFRLTGIRETPLLISENDFPARLME